MLCIEAPPDEETDMPRQQSIPEELPSSLLLNEAVQKSVPNLNALLKSASQEHIEVHAIKKPVSISSIQEKVPFTFFDKRPYRATLDIASEQKKDPVLEKVFRYFEHGWTEDLTYAAYGMIRYHEHLIRLLSHKHILFRQFIDDTGQVSHSLSCIAEYLRQQLLTGKNVLKAVDNLQLSEQRNNFAKTVTFLDFPSSWQLISKNGHLVWHLNL